MAFRDKTGLISEPLPSTVYRSNCGPKARLSTRPTRSFLSGDARRLGEVPGASVNLVIADPPFNLGLHYGPEIDDRSSGGEYEDFTRQWLSQALRVLKPGGQLFALMPHRLEVVWRSLAPAKARELVWIKNFTSPCIVGPRSLAAGSQSSGLSTGGDPGCSTAPNAVTPT